jgi:hypothetical protein
MTATQPESFLVAEVSGPHRLKTENLKISWREEISRFLCTYRRRKKLEIHKSRD